MADPKLSKRGNEAFGRLASAVAGLSWFGGEDFERASADVRGFVAAEPALRELLATFGRRRASSVTLLMGARRITTTGKSGLYSPDVTEYERKTVVSGESDDFEY